MEKKQQQQIKLQTMINELKPMILLFKQSMLF